MKGIIFDLDGTLINTLADLQWALNTYLEKNNLQPYSIEEIQSFVGNGLKVMTQRALDNRKSDLDIDLALKEFVSLYESHAMVDTVPYDDVAETLEILQERGILLAVCTNKKETLAKDLIEHYFGNINFIKIIGDMSDYPLKPDPSSSLNLVELMGLSPDQMLFVGDSAIDVETAKAAGIPFVGVTYGFQSQQAMAQLGATSFIDSLLALLNRLENSQRFTEKEDTI